jgi:TonB family protein
VAETQRRVANQAHDFVAGNAHASTAEPITHVFLLTSDDDLWIQLKDLAGPAYNIQQADSIEQTIEATVAGQAGIFIWDIRSEPQVSRGLTRLQQHSASLVPLVIDKDAAGEAVAALLKQRAILGRLTLPLAAADVGEALEVACEEASARAALLGAHGGLAMSGTFGEPRTKLIVAIATALMLIGIGVYWWMSRAPSAPVLAAVKPAGSVPAASTSARPVTPAIEGDAQAGQIEPLLANARQAMRDKRYDEPQTDCALTYYKNVLVFDAANGEARQGLDRIAELLLVRAAAAFEQHNYDNALRSIETARSISPDNPRLAALDAEVSQRRGELALGQIQAAMQAQSFDRAQQLIREAQQAQIVPADVIVRLKSDLARRQADTELSDTVKLLQARLQQGRLVEPQDDSAKYYLAAMRKKTGPANSAQLQSLAQDYTRALLQEARAAAGRQQPAEVDRWLGEAKEAGVSSRELQALQRELAQQAQKPKIDVARTVQLVGDRIGQGRLLDPPNDSAAFYLSALKAADAKNSALPDLTRHLAAELIDAARAALDDNRIADAESALQSARTFGALATDVAVLDQSIAHSKALETQRASIVSAGTLTLTRAISPIYPNDAVNSGTEGWVELLFTVDPEGKVTDVEVTNSQPKNVFDRAAMNAMKRARYEPVLLDGQPVAQRARFRIMFRLAGKK